MLLDVRVFGIWKHVGQVCLFFWWAMPWSLDYWPDRAVISCFSLIFELNDVGNGPDPKQFCQKWPELVIKNITIHRNTSVLKSSQKNWINNWEFFSLAGMASVWYLKIKRYANPVWWSSVQFGQKSIWFDLLYMWLFICVSLLMSYHFCLSYMVVCLECVLKGTWVQKF